MNCGCATVTHRLMPGFVVHEPKIRRTQAKILFHIRRWNWKNLITFLLSECVCFESFTHKWGMVWLSLLLIVYIMKVKIIRLIDDLFSFESHLLAINGKQLYFCMSACGEVSLRHYNKMSVSTNFWLARTNYSFIIRKLFTNSTKIVASMFLFCLHNGPLKWFSGRGNALELFPAQIGTAKTQC